MSNKFICYLLLIISTQATLIKDTVDNKEITTCERILPRAFKHEERRKLCKNSTNSPLDAAECALKASPAIIAPRYIADFCSNRSVVEGTCVGSLNNKNYHLADLINVCSGALSIIPAECVNTLTVKPNQFNSHSTVEVCNQKNEGTEQVAACINSFFDNVDSISKKPINQEDAIKLCKHAKSDVPASVCMMDTRLRRLDLSVIARLCYRAPRNLAPIDCFNSASKHLTNPLSSASLCQGSRDNGKAHCVSKVKESTIRLNDDQVVSLCTEANLKNATHPARCIRSLAGLLDDQSLMLLICPNYSDQTFPCVAGAQAILGDEILSTQVCIDVENSKRVLECLRSLPPTLSTRTKAKICTDGKNIEHKMACATKLWSFTNYKSSCHLVEDSCDSACGMNEQLLIDICTGQTAHDNLPFVVNCIQNVSSILEASESVYLCNGIHSHSANVSQNTKEDDMNIIHGIHSCVTMGINSFIGTNTTVELCKSNYGSTGPIECALKAPFSKSTQAGLESIVKLCQGAFDNSPSFCMNDGTSLTSLSKLQKINLCKSTWSTEQHKQRKLQLKQHEFIPIACARRALQGGIDAETSTRLCRDMISLTPAFCAVFLANFTGTSADINNCRSVSSEPRAFIVEDLNIVKDTEGSAFTNFTVSGYIYDQFMQTRFWDNSTVIHISLATGGKIIGQTKRSTTNGFIHFGSLAVPYVETHNGILIFSMDCSEIKGPCDRNSKTHFALEALSSRIGGY